MYQYHLLKNLTILFNDINGFVFSLKDTLNTLQKLITDLTLSVEIVYLSTKSLYYILGNDMYNINIQNDTIKLTCPYLYSSKTMYLTRALENQTELDSGGNLK